MSGPTKELLRAAASRRLAVLRGARQEDGWALVIALMVMVVMIGFGMAILSQADVQQTHSGLSRQRDEATQLADAGLNAEMFALSNAWPGAGDSTNQFAACTPSSTDTRCPSATTLSNLMSTPDTTRNVSWQLNVYDNSSSAGLGNFYSDQYTSGVGSYDQNGDGKLWVRAQATVGNITKTVVALVQAQKINTPLPHAVVVAGSIQLSNQGNKPIIDTQGSSAPPPGTVYVRCNPTGNPTCLQYDPTKNQISPDTTSPGYTGGSAIPANIQNQLKAEAVADGTYYSTCPASLPSGSVVWIDSGNCSYVANANVNSPNAEGVLILNHATLSLGGTLSFYGLIYSLNADSLSSTVITVQGNAQVFGAVMIDGNGGLVGGSSKLNVTFDANALNTLNTIANVSGIQSTWREL